VTATEMAAAEMAAAEASEMPSTSAEMPAATAEMATTTSTMPSAKGHGIVRKRDRAEPDTRHQREDDLA
jgi:hypothetical protein